MGSISKIRGVALASAALCAWAWLSTVVKPAVQLVFLVVVTFAVAVELAAGRRTKVWAFSLTASLASLLGYMFAAAELVARAARWLHPREPRTMQVTSLLAGAAIGVVLYWATLALALRPAAQHDRVRRAGAILLAAASVAAVSLDRLVPGPMF